MLRKCKKQWLCLLQIMIKINASTDAKELYFEGQSGIWWYYSYVSLFAVCLVGRNSRNYLFPERHQTDNVFPATDNLSAAELKLKIFFAISTAIKFIPVFKKALVVYSDDIALLGVGDSVADPYNFYFYRFIHLNLPFVIAASLAYKSGSNFNF